MLAAAHAALDDWQTTIAEERSSAEKDNALTTAFIRHANGLLAKLPETVTHGFHISRNAEVDVFKRLDKIHTRLKAHAATALGQAAEKVLALEREVDARELESAAVARGLPIIGPKRAQDLGDRKRRAFADAFTSPTGLATKHG